MASTIARVARVSSFALWLAACAPKAASHGASAPPSVVTTFAPERVDAGARAKLLSIAPKLDAHFETKVYEARSPGAIIGIVLGGELVYTRSFGHREVTTGAPIDGDTVFRIASLTKSFTAAAVVKLRDEGRLDLDKPAATYLPELASAMTTGDDAPPFSVRQLLTMASGLPYDDMWGPVTFGMNEQEFAHFVRAGIPLARAPGERYAYSNLGYALLGRIVERVSGVRFRDYVTQNILHPLGMRATAWEANDVPVNRLAVGYRRDGERLVVEPRPSDGVFDAAGGLYTSMNDYARYVAFQLSAYPPRQARESGPLRRSTIREMHSGQRWSRWRGEDFPVANRDADGKLALSAASYGFGWTENTTCSYEGIVQHGGFEPGYYASVHLLPRHGVGIVTLATGESIKWKTIEGALALLREAGLLDEPRVLPPSQSLIDAKIAVDRLLERWDPELVARAFDPHSLGYAWLQTLSEDLATLRREHGACHSQGPPQPRSNSEARWLATCERGTVEFLLLLAPGAASRIQMIQWRSMPIPQSRQGATCAE
jgi:CubicO group peptidase (beta-lactamase class C family)